MRLQALSIGVEMKDSEMQRAVADRVIKITQRPLALETLYNRHRLDVTAILDKTSFELSYILWLVLQMSLTLRKKMS